MTIKQFDVFWARFKPRRRDDLREGADAWIGRALLWSADWIIDEGDYQGQFACVVFERPAGGSPPFVWVPLCDLADIQPRTPVIFQSSVPS